VLARLSFVIHGESGLCHAFSAHILVSGSPIDDDQIKQNFRRGDPLTPFAFSAIIEGLYRLVTEVVADGKFKEYKVLTGISFFILQFADDTFFAVLRSQRFINEK